MKQRMNQRVNQRAQKRNRDKSKGGQAESLHEGKSRAKVKNQKDHKARREFESASEAAHAELRPEEFGNENPMPLSAELSDGLTSETDRMKTKRSA